MQACPWWVGNTPAKDRSATKNSMPVIPLPSIEQ
jgi:hypothetical protein